MSVSKYWNFRRYKHEKKRGKNLKYKDLTA
jgi:hypothetical protein